MTAASIPSPQITELRFVEVCPECGYSLVGSPDEGICPECGEKYDQSVLILHGAAMGERAHVGNASRRSLLRTFVVPGIYLIGPLTAYFSHVRLEAVDIVVIALWGLIISFWLFSRWTNRRPGLIAVYLSPRGCLQRDDTVERTIPRTFFPSFSLLLSLSFLVYVCARDEELSVRLRQIGIVGICIIFSAFFLLRAIRAPVRPPRRRTPAQRLETAGHRWSGSETVLMSNTSEGRAQLRISTIERFRLTRTYVDAEVVCSSERCARIEQLIAQWIRDPIAQSANPAKSS